MEKFIITNLQLTIPKKWWKGCIHFPTLSWIPNPSPMGTPNPEKSIKYGLECLVDQPGHQYETINHGPSTLLHVLCSLLIRSLGLLPVSTVPLLTFELPESWSLREQCQDNGKQPKLLLHPPCIPPIDLLLSQLELLHYPLWFQVHH